MPTLVTGPATQPVALAEAKAWLRVDSSDEDGLIEAMIAAAVADAESETGRRFVEQTWDFAFDRFFDVMRIPYPPLQSVVSISYVDSVGDTQTLDASAYDVLAGEYRISGEVRRAYGVEWPETRRQAEAATIRCVVGYGEASDVPDGIKQAILARVNSRFKREPTPGEDAMFQRLLDPWRIGDV